MRKETPIVQRNGGRRARIVGLAARRRKRFSLGRKRSKQVLSPRVCEPRLSKINSYYHFRMHGTWTPADSYKVCLSREMKRGEKKNIIATNQKRLYARVARKEKRKRKL